MNKVIEPNLPFAVVYTMIAGIIFFASGILINDIYTFVAGTLLITIGTVQLTGVKIINRIDKGR